MINWWGLDWTQAQKFILCVKKIGAWFQSSGGVFWQAEKKGGVLGAGAAARQRGGGLKGGSSSKEEVLGAGQVKKGDLYRGTHLYWTYMWVPPPRA